jgi:type VI secretion system secreted protein Hcp
MALNAYLRLKGEEQGEIQGSVTQAGLEGTIMVIAAEHSLTRPLDAAKGLPTSQRTHVPFKITKEVDKASPLLYAALIASEKFAEWELQFYRFSQTAAQDQNNFTVKLTNAVITEIESVLPNNKDPDLTKLEQYEVVSFVYHKIEWTWVDGGLTSEDDWTV